MQKKITIDMDKDLIKRIDRLVQAHVFYNRSEAIQAAVQEKISRLDKSRLAREATKLDPSFEQALADEGLRK